MCEFLLNFIQIIFSQLLFNTTLNQIDNFMILGVTKESLCILLKVCLHSQITFFKQLKDSCFVILIVHSTFNILEPRHILANVLDHPNE
jgi:hypothetical protein